MREEYIPDSQDKEFDMTEITVEGLKDLLANWKFIFTWGTDLDVYGNGDKRMGIDRATGNIRLEYEFRSRYAREIRPTRY